MGVADTCDATVTCYTVGNSDTPHSVGDTVTQFTTSCDTVGVSDRILREDDVGATEVYRGGSDAVAWCGGHELYCIV